MATAESFKTIRSWDGSQPRAFEELCYQLRDATPPSAKLTKTGDPDGGVEWYINFADGTQWGWQAKYSFDIDTLLQLMETSLVTVVGKRPKLNKLTYCIPWDLPDAPDPAGGRKSARQKFEERKTSWRERIAGADNVEIELLTAGDLVDRLARPEHRGREWFFWEEHVLDTRWCEAQLEITKVAAGPRYTPELHIDLPVAFSLEGLAQSDRYATRYRARRGEVIRAAAELFKPRGSGGEMTQKTSALKRAVEVWEDAASQTDFGPEDPLPVQQLGEATRAAESAAEELRSAIRTKRDERHGKRTYEDRLNSLLAYLMRYSAALNRYDDFMASTATLAASRRALLITGEAGQGKTHMFCDAGETAIERGQPALVLLAGRFSPRTLWTSIQEQLGLPNVGRDVLIQALSAAGEASGSPVVLLVDALNESDEASVWQVELPALRAALQLSPWLALGVSCRSTYRRLVLPTEGLGDAFAEIDHPGFRGRELEATEQFFSAFGIEQPRVPLLLPEFSNPLFLKLYCEGLHGLGLSAPPSGHSHLTEVFDRYLESRASVINTKLKLDPVDRAVEEAVADFARAVSAASDRDGLERSAAKSLIDAYAPHLSSWPDTLFGQLLAENVLTEDLAWRRGPDQADGLPVESVRFSYQKFSDHRVVSAALDLHLDSDSPRDSFEPGSPLRDWVEAASVGWIEALSVQLPERTGMELLDVAEWTHAAARGTFWLRSLVLSIVPRDRASITPRTRELLREAERANSYLAEHVLEAMLSVAPDPDHPLNALQLDRALTRMKMPHRDVSWSRRMYHALGEAGAMERLLRWAARGPHEAYPAEVLELAAIPIVWMFTSPNRYVRDYATKALVQLLHRDLAVVQRLLERFLPADDPYVVERMAVVAHGAILRGGRDQLESARAVNRVMTSGILSPEAAVLPNLLTRDAARGVAEWCHASGLTTSEEYERARPPYRSKRPFIPRSKAYFEERYERRNYERRDGYLTLFSSIFDHGDFGRYVIGSKTDDFSLYPLTRPRPAATKRPYTVRETDPEKLAQFQATLSDEQAALIDAEAAGGSAFVESLTEEQVALFLDGYRSHVVRPKPDPKRQYPAERAERWVFQRTLSLGWTPERFAAFDHTRDYGDMGRSPHKAERFGKKYQWIAFRELLARISDNYHMNPDFGEERAYRGPWQFYGRDIDPTLPPPPHDLDEDDERQFGDTYPAESQVSWWTPSGPAFRRDEAVGPEWVYEEDDLPEFETTFRRVDTDGTSWVVLKAYYKWDEEVGEDEDRYERTRRDLWCHVNTWLIKDESVPQFEAFLADHWLMGRWMPEGHSVTDAGYLGEMPWAEAAREHRQEWQVPGRAEETDFEVLPANAEYMWEGNVLDCSLVNAVGAFMPCEPLFEAEGLEWVSGARAWMANGRTVAEHREAETGTESHTALLVREDWLRDVLERQGLGLGVGLLGEKRMLPPTFSRREEHRWLEVNGVATYVGGRWNVGDRRTRGESSEESENEGGAGSLRGASG